MLPLTVIIPWSVASWETASRVQNLHFVREAVKKELPEALVTLAIQEQGQWNKSRLLNKAIAEATTSLVLVLDADVVLPWKMLRQLLQNPVPLGTIVKPFTFVYRLSSANTEDLRNGKPFLIQPNLPKVNVLGGGAFIIHRDTFARIGGFDERYAGYLFEDSDFQERARHLDVRELKSPALHLYHESFGNDSAEAAQTASNKKLLELRAVQSFEAQIADTQNPFKTSHGPVPSSGQLCRFGVFLAFNQPFVEYAAALIQSVLGTNPDWRIFAFATNVASAEFDKYPFTHAKVQVFPETVLFADFEEERCYMNSRRFLRYAEFLSSSAVDLALMLDADSLVVENLSSLASVPDIGIVFRDYETLPEKRLRACTVVSRANRATSAFWGAYKSRLPVQTWYADQLALSGALAQTARLVRVQRLAEQEYSAFRSSPETKVLVTCTEDKLGFHGAQEYASRFKAIQTKLTLRRGQSIAEHTALVLVVFGNDHEREQAICRGISATIKDVTLPAVVLLLDARPNKEIPLVVGQLPSGSRWVTVPIEPGPRSQAVWEKEILWEIARKYLAQLHDITCAAFLDADCTPSVEDFFLRVQDAHSSGIKVMQPWERCTDTFWSNIGGTSCCWREAFGHQSANTFGAQPGFCWSFDLAWLESIGGFPMCEPLGGGDSMLMQMVFSKDHGLPAEASYMRKIAAEKKIPRQPFAALDRVKLTHQSHGSRENRGYGLRYRVAQLASPDILSLYRVAENGLLEVVETPLGDAWLEMLSRRSEWATHSVDEKTIALWHSIQERHGL